MSLKVLLIINRLEDNGGAEVSTGLLIDGLQGKGFQFIVVTLFGPAESALRGDLEMRGVEFVEVQGARRNQLRQVIRLIDEFSPQLIHSTLSDSDFVAALAGARTGVPTMTSVVNVAYGPSAAAVASSNIKLRTASFLVSQLRRFGFSHCHAITDTTAETIRSAKVRERTTVVPRGRAIPVSSELAHVERREVLADLGIADDSFVVLNVARQEAQKGHDLLLRSFADLRVTAPDATLLIAGRQGKKTAAIEADISNLGLSSAVQLLDVRDDVPRLLRAADVFAFSSRWEGLGGSVLEAMAAELPIVSYDIPAIAEVCADTARLVPPFDTAAFAQELEWIRTHQSEAAEMASRAKERFSQNFELVTVNGLMAELYRSVAELPPPPLARLLAPHRARSGNNG